MIQLSTVKRVTPVALFKRAVNVTPNALYNAWTDPKQVAVWWGPFGFTNPVCIWMPRAQGIIYVEMRSADGMLFPLNGIFHEAIPYKRVSFTTKSFEDEDGKPQMIVVNNITFAIERKTTVFELETKVIKATPIVTASLDEMQLGWRQSLDKLEEFLLRRKNNNQ